MTTIKVCKIRKQILKPSISTNEIVFQHFIQNYCNDQIDDINQAMEAQKKYIQPFKEVFLFINSASGGGLGQEIMDMHLTELNFDVPKSQYSRDQKNIVRVDIHVYNLKDSVSKKEGFERLKKYLNEKKGEPILIICGGDGTVMWVVTQMSLFGIEHGRVPMAIIPLGTGNDFSQTLGWGKESPDLLSNNFEKLKKRVSYWLSAQEENLDIWMVQAEVQEYGKFQRVENKETKIVQGKTFAKHFCNYFSVGVDGKIGYSFDLHRTGSRIGNLAVYGAMGFVKSFTKTKNIGQLAVSLRDSSKQQGENLDIRASKNFDKSIFQTGTNGLSAIEGNENLLALNINSFMGGVTDVWKNAKVRPHLKDEKFTDASHSDGKLDFVSFSGVWSLGFEKTSSGNGQKVYQGSGPFELAFKKYPSEEKHRTYLQIDGEFIRYTHPSRLVIRKSTLSATSQVRVLRRVPLEVQKGCCSCMSG